MSSKIFTAKPRCTILCDRDVETSFGQCAIALQKALSDNWLVDILWITSPKYFPNGSTLQPQVALSDDRLGYLQAPSPVVQALRPTAPQWIILVHQFQGYLLRHLKKAFPTTHLSAFIHDLFSYDRTEWRYRLINRFFFAPCLNAHSLLFNSHWTQKQFLNKFRYSRPQTVIGCAVDPTRFLPAVLFSFNEEREEGRKEGRKELLERLHLPPDRPLYLTISLDEPRKNIITWLRLSQHYPEVTFLRIGKKSSWIEEWITNHIAPNIFHLHNVSNADLGALYRHCTLFLFPSLLEGFGLPPLEALACGATVISSGRSAMAETLTGVATLIDNPKDLEEWKKAIAQPLNPSHKSVDERLSLYSIDALRQRLCEHWSKVELKKAES